MPDRATDPEEWLAAFHAGERPVLEACYRDHLATVAQAVGRVLEGADQETVIQDVFLRLLTDARMRAGFRDGAFAAWLTTVARNAAIDFVRRHRKERLVGAEALEALAGGRSDPLEARLEARRLLDEFQRRLPAKWAPVFEARFIQHLDQRSAATAIGISRTTLAYRETVIRRRLRRYLLREEEP